MEKTLWNKNFTIITLGTIVSMLGNTLSNFSLSLLVNQTTQSTLSFAIYLMCYSIPKILVPGLAGTFLDRRSRLKTIYVLDFLSSALFLLLFFILKSQFFNFEFFLLIAIILGTIDSIYAVAYDSLYPTLITPGQFSKAYSISSLIYPLASMTLPIAVILRDSIGVEYIFLFNAFSFLIAAFFETQIQCDESQLLQGRLQAEPFWLQFKEGIHYIQKNSGLMVIVAYFFINSMFQTSVSQTLELPYFDKTLALGAQFFTYVNLANVIGRFIGGMLHYRYKIPSNKKFNIAFAVYLTITMLHGLYLYFPKPLIILGAFLIGLFSVTSFNIRISSTQSYIDNTYRARFNGAFQAITTLGVILGQLLSGYLGERIGAREILLGANLIVFVFTFIIVYQHRNALKEVYNRKV